MSSKKLVHGKLTDFNYLFKRITQPICYSATLKRILFIPKEISPTNINIYAYEYKDGYAFSLADIAKYTNKTSSLVTKAFRRITERKNEILGHSTLLENVGFINVEKELLSLSDKNPKGGRPEKFLILEEGFPIMLGALRGETKDALFYAYNSTFFKMLRTARKLKYVKHFILSADNPKLLTAPINGKKIAISGHLVDSRGELIIASVLDSLGIEFQHGIYDFEDSVNFDFYIRNSYPHKFIEYFGLDTRSYKARRVFKEKVIRRLESTGLVKFLIIEPKEVEDIPFLTDKIRDFLGTK